ncbi:alpha-N-acetylgalactosaminide alpha-2,6-sialyltransferase 1 isoform X2 [Carettochelys insculpta]|uniref:alpha-N-acetylgalactosaminide alpha-2,6-sialyltransferase 1 isoform X2 n=1 Tax=Carettochelys insculpta TaxID=44489 RepID=UPI003EB69776
MLRQRPGNQVWGLPHRAPGRGRCQPPWQVARRKRASGSGRRRRRQLLRQLLPGMPAAPKAKAGAGSVAAGPKGKAAGGPNPKPTAGSVVAPAVAAGPGPVAEVAGESVEELTVAALDPVANVAERGTTQTTTKVATEELTGTTTAASSGTVGKATSRSRVTSSPGATLAASNPMAMCPSGNVANGVIHSSNFGSPAATLLPEDNSGLPVYVSAPNSSSTLAFKDPVASVAATKRHNSNGPMCGNPAAKNLKLPGPDNSHSPALLEAFKAVIAAGGSGWLDPSAVAAVRTKLEVGCSFEEDLGSGSRETSGKSSEPEQLTWTPTLLVRGRRRKKKPVNQERTTFVTLVPCTENKIKETKVNSPRSEDQAEAYNMEPMQSFSPPQSPIRSMVPGGGNFMQAEPKEIWICGHSVILLTKKRASTHPHGLQLGFPISSAFVYWHGIQAMLWDQLLPLLHEIYYLRSSPSIIVIHLGENDLVQQSRMSLIVKMKSDLGILRRAFPDTHIIWSSMLPRRFWKRAEKPKSIEKETKIGSDFNFPALVLACIVFMLALIWMCLKEEWKYN